MSRGSTASQAASTLITIVSRSHAAHASPALVGHSIVIRELRLRIRTRIARSVNYSVSIVDGGEFNRTWSASATGQDNCRQLAH